MISLWIREKDGVFIVISRNIKWIFGEYAKLIVNLYLIRDLIVNSLNTKWIYCEFAKKIVYLSFIREKDSEFI